MNRRQEMLGRALIDKRAITPEQLRSALEEQERTRRHLWSILLERRMIGEKELLRVMSEHFNIPYTSIEYKYLDWDFVRKFSPSLILDHRCLPIEEGDYVITVAIDDPLDAWPLQKAEEETRGFKLKPVLVSERDMSEAIKRYKDYVQKRDS